jgi:hypothetical protein
MTSSEPGAFERMAILENGIEAQLLGAILTERNLPHRISSYHDTAYDGLFQVQRGWGEVCAPAGVRDELQEILDDLRRSENQFGSGG